MDEREYFEQLKKEYIEKTEWLLKGIEELKTDDIKNANVKAEIALRHSESVTSFMSLSLVIFAKKPAS